MGELHLISGALPITDRNGPRQKFVNANKMILVLQMFKFICKKIDCEYMSPSKRMKAAFKRGGKKDTLNLYRKLYTIQNQSKLFKPLDTRSVIMLPARSTV